MTILFIKGVASIRFTDQVGNEATVPFPPRRIVSLVPSITELLYDLGLEEYLVGVTKFCCHPEQAKSDNTIIGGTKSFHLDKISALDPDLIIGNKEENYKEGIEALQKDYPVFLSDISSIEDSIDFISSIAKITSSNGRARDMKLQMSVRQDAFLNEINATGKKPRVVYLIWNEPFMTIGGDTYINTLLGLSGFENCFDDQERYPEIDLGDIKNKAPDFIFLSSEPFPFGEKHFSSFEDILPKSHIKLVDGEMFSWFGSRLLLAFDYFTDLRKELNLTS